MNTGACERRTMLLSHTDLRVTDRARAAKFYAALLGMLGATMRETEHWTTFGRDGERDTHWFGFTEDRAARAGSVRTAFAAASRDVVDAVAAALPSLGARTIEGPDTSEGYYAVFFEDMDGNRLEVAYVA